MGNYADRFFTTDTRNPMPERRREIRAQMRQFIELRVDQEVFGEARTIDINSGGLRVFCARPIEPGTRIFVMFELPKSAEGDAWVRGEYVAVHCDREGDGWRVGLRAFRLEGESQKHVNEFLATS